MTGGNGRIDLCGKPRAEAAYTLVALEQAEGPFLAVHPVYEKEHPRFTGWQLTKALQSWSWEGCEGEPAEVEVYSRAAQVELLVNGTSAGKKKVGKTCRVIFKTTWQPGTVEAVAYDASGRELSRNSLVSAGSETELRAEPESETARKDGLVYVPIRYTDKSGVWKPMEKHLLDVTVENGALLGLGNAAPYFKGNYNASSVKTFFGEALAVVRADGRGPLRVTVSDGARVVTAEIPVER